MALSIDQVKYIAALARLEFEEHEEQKLAEEMNEILGYMEKLNELDTSQVEPMSHVLDITNVFREDRIEERITHQEALMNAPDANEHYFLVPKVIE